MSVILKNGREVIIRSVDKQDTEKLFKYFNHLSDDTKKKFGPHSFDRDMIEKICNHVFENMICFVAETADDHQIIAYAVLHKGFLAHDAPRLSGYGLQPDNFTDITFAPSVADAWQSSGAGSKMFECISEYLQQHGFKRIILWGGVQCSNERAVNFYKKFGFIITGSFEYNGMNYDMVKVLV